jgi:hypothetical protein
MLSQDQTQSNFESTINPDDLGLTLNIHQPKLLCASEAIRSIVLEKRLLAAAESSSACSKPTPNENSKEK